MARFKYSALSAAGTIVTGEVDAPDAATVIDQLHSQALLPIYATEARSRPAAFRWRRAPPRALPLGELALFTQQLARLLKAGLPLDRALGILLDLATARQVRHAVRDVQQEIRGGASLAEAMTAGGGAFPSTYVSMVRAGEAGGALPGVLARVSEFLNRAEALRQKVASALIYPAVLIVVAAVSLCVALVFVLPQFEPVFRDAGARLPALTQGVMFVSDILRLYWWVVLLTFAVLALAGQWVMRRPGAVLQRDRLVLSLPLIRELITKLEISRFSRTLGVLLANGVPVARALALCVGTVGNRVLATAIDTVGARLKEGEGLSEPLGRTARFPGLAIQLIRIGEETGRLDTMLGELADLYDQEIQRSLERLVVLLVPAITIVMGILVALIISAIMLAMISVNDLVIQ